MRAGTTFVATLLVLAVVHLLDPPASAAKRKQTPTPKPPPTATRTPTPRPTATTTPKPSPTATPKPTPTATPQPTATPAGQSFGDSFNTDGAIEETGAMSQSSSPNWWMNSGGRLTKSGGYGHTVQGDLPEADYWRRLYAQNNPLDTDDGYHPQNLFRFVLRSRWRNFDQLVYFRINRVNMSVSPNRNASNGVLLFNRYQDGQTLYYAGVRVDGAAVIKKKLAGVYTTLAYGGIFPGYGTFDVTNNPNLIPENQWIGLRTMVTTNADGSVEVQLLVDQGGGWNVVLDAVDTGASAGPPITADGYAGIRTDFMDADFESYSIAER
jgi:hypothetical protein